MNPPFFQQPHTINAPDVVAEDFDGQVVILNLANGHYFSLEGCAGDIWALLSEGHTPASILASINNGEPAIHDDSVTFLNTVMDLELLRPNDAAGPNPAPIATAWRKDPPRLEIYKDLAELIYADPIHDVDDQAGWPKPREDH